MSSFLNPENSNYSVPQPDILEYTYRPEVYFVAAGSYASTNFGAGAAPIESGGVVETYNAATLRVADDTADLPASKVAVSKIHKQVQFQGIIAIDGTIANPYAATVGEIRITAVPPLTSQPIQWARKLPAPAPGFPLPLFDAYLVGPDGTTLLPTVANSALKVRVLPTGDLALVNVAYGGGAAVVTAVTQALFNTAVFVAGGAGTAAEIIFEGGYIAA